MNNPRLAQNYLKAKVFTATPEQLQLMLFDGALRFGEQAKVALQERKFEQSFNALTRMQNIVTQMSCSLKPKVYPDLCEKLAALYNYIFRLLVAANVRHDIEALDEALSLLRYQRETWVLMLEQLTKAKAAATAATLDIPEPDEQMEEGLHEARSTLSVQG